MTKDTKDFWSRFQSGVTIAVGSEGPDKLLGVRDGFRRYFHEGLERPVPVVVIPQQLAEPRPPLPLTDADILELARKRACELQSQHPKGFDFYVGSEAGLLTFEAGGQMRHFVRSWTVLLALGDEAWGSSGSVELPSRLIQGLEDEQIPFAVPGTRRSGGMVASLTYNLETRRSSTALATLHALSSLMYGFLESRPRR